MSEEVKKEKKFIMDIKINIYVVMLIIFLTILLTGTTVYLLTQRSLEVENTPTNAQGELSDNTDKAEENVTEPIQKGEIIETTTKIPSPIDYGTRELTTYNEEYTIKEIEELPLYTITADIPENWSMTLKYNYVHIDPTYEGYEDYSEGLDELTIENPDKEEIFQLYTVHGPMGWECCVDVFKFPDTNFDSIKSATHCAYADEPYYIEPEVVKEGEYTEFDFLGNRTRRVGTRLVYDTTEAETFDPKCNDQFVWDFNNLYTRRSSLTDETASIDIDTVYLFMINRDTTEQDLLILDTILESMEIVEYK